MTGEVVFVGAGPGAADLITIRGLRAIATSQVCLYAGSLVPEDLLGQCPPDAHKVDTARMTLDEIVAELVAAHEAGHDVARLCSGDPAVFSAVAEQSRRLDAAGVAWDVTPGVPAYAAAAALLGRELTAPELSQTVILTRAQARSTAMPETEALPLLARSRATVVLHLAITRIRQVVQDLLPEYGPDAAVAVVANASAPGEVVLRGTLSDIAGQVAEAGVRRTAVVIVGRALTAGQFPDSHLYSTTRERSGGVDPST